jgi:hypothetical protein
MKSPRSKRVTRLLAFGPALVMVSVTAWVASGASVVGTATGASTVGVTGTVSSSFSTDPGITGGGGASGCADESVGAGFASTAAASNGCTITFSSNNATGAHVVFDNNNAGAVDFFCGDPDGAGALPRDCATNGNTVDDLVGSGNMIVAEGFGLALKSVGGDAGTARGSGISALNPAATLGAASWSGIPDQGSAVELCDFPSANTTNSTCNFAFGALGKGGTQGAGDYSGTLRLTAALT